MNFRKWRENDQVVLTNLSGFQDYPEEDIPLVDGLEVKIIDTNMQLLYDADDNGRLIPGLRIRIQQDAKVRTLIVPISCLRVKA